MHKENEELFKCILLILIARKIIETKCRQSNPMSRSKEQSLRPSKHAVFHGVKEVMTERGCSELTVI